jgi:hypothetical protein
MSVQQLTRAYTSSDSQAAIAAGADSTLTIGPGVTAADASGQARPQSCQLVWLLIKVSAIAGGATSVVYQLYEDSDFDIALTQELTTLIEVGKTTATEGTVQALIDLPYAPTDGGTSQTLYLRMRSDVGTFTAHALLYWVR